MHELSIVIPTYNRAESLRACLDSLSRQTQSVADYEVIVVVDGSTDGTREMLAHLSLPYPLHTLWQSNSGQTEARNRGIAAAKGRYVLFLDDDIVAGPELVAEHLRAQREHGGVAAIGQLETVPQQGADGFARCMAEWLNDHYARLNAGTRAPAFRDCYSGNLSVPLAALHELGGFALDLRSSFDVELGYRLAQYGLSFVYLPRACGRQDYDKNARAILTDAVQDGAASYELYRRHPAMLPHLALSQFEDTTTRQVMLRRSLLALHAPLPLLAWVGGLLGDRPMWYRFVYDYGYWSGVRRAAPDRDTWRRLIHGTLILMYHAFGAKGEPASRYVIPADRFARQLAWLRLMGYKVISREDYLRCRSEHRLPPARSLVITIDDGYADTRTLALPALRRHGFPATIFLVSKSVGGVNTWDTDSTPAARPLAGRSLLTWADVREMLHGAILFGAHSRTHPQLTSLPPEQVSAEVAGSRADLERALAAPILVFSYPHGRQDDGVRCIVEQAGYLGACGVRAGINTARTPLHQLYRNEVYGTDSLLDFALHLWLGFDRRHTQPRPTASATSSPEQSSAASELSSEA